MLGSGILKNPVPVNLKRTILKEFPKGKIFTNMHLLVRRADARDYGPALLKLRLTGGERAVQLVPGGRPSMGIYLAQNVCRLRPAGVLWGSLLWGMAIRDINWTHRQMGHLIHVKWTLTGGISKDKLCQK